MKFLIPSTFGEDVVIESQVTEWKRSSFDVHHRLLRGEELAVEGFETRVWTVYDPDRPGRLKSQTVPDEVKAAFK
jgi:4-hydroxybenzoyl-CoA thioesterase